MVAAVITTWGATRQLRGELNALDDRTDKAEAASSHISADIARLATERAQCELRAVRSSATKEELVRAIAEGNVLRHELLEMVGRVRDDLVSRTDDVHARISELGEDFNNFKGRMGKPQ